jgi:hypothetical protein
MVKSSPEDGGKPDWPLEVEAMHFINGNDV